MNEPIYPGEPIFPNVSEALAFEPSAQSPKPKSRRVRLLLFLILFTAGAGWYFIEGRHYFFPKGEESVPVIKAEPGPIKVAPDKPGGMEAADLDKNVYEKMEGGSEGPKVERLLPPAETPLPPNSPGLAPSPAAAPVPQVAMAPIQSAPVLLAPPSAPPPPPAASGEPGAKASIAPNLGKVPPAMFGVKTDNSQKNIAPKVLTPAAPTTEDVLAIKPPLPAPPPPEPSKFVEAPNKQTPQARDAGAAREPSLASKQGAAKKPAADDGNFFKVQLAAVRSREQAQSEWERLSKAHFELLGGLELFVTKVDFGANKGIFYRLRAGPLGDEDAARELCAKLSVKNLGCLIVYPGG